jgi:RimJ/RimL family protein N-acetyltransferase
LKVGKILRKFNAKDGKNVILRTPKWKDLDDLLELINSLVDEKAEIYITEKFTREEEAKWLLEVITSLEKDEEFFLTAEVDKKVVALADFQIKKGDKEHRVGAIGIIVKKGYRNLGIGTEILKTILEQAAFFGLRNLTINVFATNKRAIHVYKKVGFIESGIIPNRHFRQGKLIDEIIMKKRIA